MCLAIPIAPSTGPSVWCRRAAAEIATAGCAPPAPLRFGDRSTWLAMTATGEASAAAGPPPHLTQHHHGPQDRAPPVKDMRRPPGRRIAEAGQSMRPTE